MGRLQLAVGVPNVKEYGDPRVIRDLAIEAERAHWDGFFVWEHLLYRDEMDDVADSFTAVTAAAAATRTIRIGVMVAAHARRRPWKVAREIATLDQLTGGRVAFGAGLGSLAEEFERFGEDPDSRVRAEKLDESLDIVTGLWTGEPFSYEGSHFTVRKVRFSPRPVQRPRVPVWIAGRWPNRKPFRRAARWDGVFATHHQVGHTETMSLEQLQEIVDYTMANRNEPGGAFDVVIEGQTSGEDPQAEADLVAEYAAGGLTWWVEKLGWFRGTLDETRERIKRGPPRK
jgi:alkanesulfonate monooxygenase SsuD/methylene tetrahydromethanopterin reductase-like flavin-dependent oxidoreductase (luciferase family)